MVSKSCVSRLSAFMPVLWWRGVPKID